MKQSLSIRDQNLVVIMLAKILTMIESPKFMPEDESTFLESIVDDEEFNFSRTDAQRVALIALSLLKSGMSDLDIKNKHKLN